MYTYKRDEHVGEIRIARYHTPALRWWTGPDSNWDRLRFNQRTDFEGLTSFIRIEETNMDGHYRCVTDALPI